MSKGPKTCVKPMGLNVTLCMTFMGRQWKHCPLPLPTGHWANRNRDRIEQQKKYRKLGYTLHGIWIIRVDSNNLKE